MNKRRVIAIVVALLAAVGGFIFFSGGPSNARALLTGTDIKDQSLQSRDLGEGSVATSELRDGGTYFKDLSAGTQALINGSTAKNRQQDSRIKALEDAPAPRDGVDGNDGTNGTDGEDGVVAPLYTESSLQTIQDVGGSFGKFPEPRATQLDTLALDAGTYILSSEGFFINNSPTSGQTRMQLAVRAQDGTDWGVDLGTCFTGAISELANRESHCSSTRVITLTEAEDVIVYGFGYADDQGSADSGKVSARSYLTATPVQTP